MLIVVKYSNPAFKWLFPNQHNNIPHILFFCLAKWHALAKLQLHTDDSLILLDASLQFLGSQLWKLQQPLWQHFKPRSFQVKLGSRGRMHWQVIGESNHVASAPPHLHDAICTYLPHSLYVFQIHLFPRRAGPQMIKRFYAHINKKMVPESIG